MASNRYAGICELCGGNVPAYKGIVLKDGTTWKTYHKEGECPKKKTEKITCDEYQQKIVDAITSGAAGPQIIVDAKAGSGKTTIECYGLSILHARFPDLKIIVLAFGNEDGKRMRSKLIKGVEGKTTHSFCMEVLKTHYPEAKLNLKKLPYILDCVCGQVGEDDALRNKTSDLLSKVQADAVLKGDWNGMRETIESYDLNIDEDEEEKVFKCVDACLDLGSDIVKYGYTFDDALYIIATRNLSLPKYDVVGLDEVQDFNECQLRIVDKFIQSGARVIAVGDPNQSLYAFRGAQHDSFDRVREVLQKSTRSASELPMPRCRRCSKAVIREAQKIVPEIQALPDAPEGEVKKDVNAADLLSKIKSKDMVVCRVNAPLVRLKYLCISLGIKAYMRGGNQEARLLSWYVDLFSKQMGPPTEDIGELTNRGQQWLAERAKKCNGYKLAVHQARIEVINLIGERVLTVTQLKKEINKLFQVPTNCEDYIVLSTIHRSKGSEAQNVWHIHPELVPHPKATTPKELAQENNALYVAITRAIYGYYECLGDITTPENNKR